MSGDMDLMDIVRDVQRVGWGSGDKAKFGVCYSTITLVPVKIHICS